MNFMLTLNRLNARQSLREKQGSGAHIALTDISSSGQQSTVKVPHTPIMIDISQTKVCQQMSVFGWMLTARCKEHYPSRTLAQESPRNTVHKVEDCADAL
jgi:hypothetical protein